MNLLSLVEHVTGAEFKWQARKDGGEYGGPCPFCHDGTDRFRVWPNHPQTPMWWCRVCGKHGGSILLMTQLYQLSVPQAKERLLEMGYQLDEQPYEPRREKKVTVLAPSEADLRQFVFDVNAVYAWHKEHRQKAIDYFSQWQLTPEDVDRHWLGYGSYNNGQGYSIPHWWLDHYGNYILKGVKFRHETTDPKRRFSTVTNSLTRGIWNPRWVSNPDGTREGPILNHLFILEAEKDAALLDGYGYPAVALFPEAAWMHYMPVVLRNVIQPIIVYDEDGGKGLERALTIADYLKTRPILASTHEWQIKSPSDLAKEYGRNAIHDWVRSLKLDITTYESN